MSPMDWARMEKRRVTDVYDPKWCTKGEETSWLLMEKMEDQIKINVECIRLGGNWQELATIKKEWQDI